MKYGITFDFLQYYLPTKRHKNEVARVMTTCREVEVRELSEEEFPVALKVTDYNILPHKERTVFDEMFDTIEIRWDGTDLYEEPRIFSGSNKGELMYKDVSSLSHLLKRAAGTMDQKRYIPEGKKYVNGISEIRSEDMESRLKNMKSVAANYVICNGRVWHKCGQPYYRIYTFGDGSSSLSIEWTEADNIDKIYYLATQRDLALSDYFNKLNGFGNNKTRLEKLIEKGEPRNIEVLIPESYSLRRDVESEEYPGYVWSDKMGCYVKDYGDRLSPVHEDTYLVRFRHNYGDRCLARVYVDNKYAFTNLQSIWFVAGRIMQDCKEVSFDDIVEIYSVNQDKNLLTILNEEKPCRRRIATGIEWETDGEDVDLPEEVEIPENVSDDDIADYLSDKYNFLVASIDDVVEAEEVAV